MKLWEKQKKNLTLKAFTLVELIIVIVLISFLSAIFIPIALSQLQGSDAGSTVIEVMNNMVQYQQQAYARQFTTTNCTGADFSTLSSSRTYTMFSGTWDSGTGLCNNRYNQTVNLTGSTNASTSFTSNIIFPPGSFRPHPNMSIGTTNNLSGVVTTITSGTNFSPAPIVGDIVALSSTPTTYATVLTVNSGSSITVDTAIGTGGVQTLNIAPRGTVTLSNNSTKYIYNLTSEGMMYVQKVS